MLKQLNSFYNYERTDIISSTVDRTKVGHTPSESASKNYEMDLIFTRTFSFNGSPAPMFVSQIGTVS